MKYLIADDEVRTMSSRYELQVYLDFRKENDVWTAPIARECAAVGIDDKPMFYNQYRTEYSIDTPDEVLDEVANSDTKLLLVYPSNNKYCVEQVRYTAFNDICKRAGLEGRTMDLMEPKGKFTPIDPMLRGQFLSTGLHLSEEICKVLYRDDKVTAMKSNRYVIFPEHELIDILEKTLKEEWPEYAFVKATVCHEYLLVDYLLNCSELEESFKMQLEDCGVILDEIKVGVKFATSDVGSSCVSLAPYCIINGEQETRLGNMLKLKHDNGNTIKDYIKLLSQIAVSFKEAEDRIEELGNTPIKYPSGCLQRIINSCSIIPSNIAKEIVEEMEIEYAGGKVANAVDIYLKLNEVPERCNSIEKLSPTKIINLSETIAKLMFVDYGNYDKPIMEE